MTSSRTRRLAIRITTFCLAASLVVPAGGSFAASGARSDLANTQREIAATLAQLKQVSQRAEQSEAALAEAKATVAKLEAQLNEVLFAVIAQEERVAAAQAEADAAQAEADRIGGLVNARAVQAFMGGTPNAFTVLTESSDADLSGALDQIAMLNALAARDAASIETLASARIQAAASAERLAGALDELADARAVQEQLLADAETVMTARSEVLAAVTTDLDHLEAEQERLEDEAGDIQALIAAEEAAARKRAAAARKAADDAAAAATSSQSTGGTSEPAPKPKPQPPATGCYSWPASGKVTSEFGPRWGRMHAGLDIDGNTGDRLTAAQAGTVIFAGRQGGYGNLTLISHSDGVTTAYAHQSAFGVSKGEVVARGQYIGRMGATGNVTGSHLHFETRTSSGAKNPRNYLC